MFPALVGYRTYLVAVLAAVFGALAIVDWNAVVADPAAGWATVVMAVVMAAMRAITSTPPGEKP